MNNSLQKDGAPIAIVIDHTSKKREWLYRNVSDFYMRASNEAFDIVNEILTEDIDHEVIPIKTN